MALAWIGAGFAVYIGLHDCGDSSPNPAICHNHQPLLLFPIPAATTVVVGVLAVRLRRSWLLASGVASGGIILLYATIAVPWKSW